MIHNKNNGLKKHSKICNEMSLNYHSKVTHGTAQNRQCAFIYCKIALVLNSKTQSSEAGVKDAQRKAPSSHEGDEAKHYIKISKYAQNSWKAESCQDRSFLHIDLYNNRKHEYLFVPVDLHIKTASVIKSMLNLTLWRGHWFCLLESDSRKGQKTVFCLVSIHDFFFQLELFLTDKTIKQQINKQHVKREINGPTRLTKT